MNFFSKKKPAVVEDKNQRAKSFAVNEPNNPENQIDSNSKRQQSVADSLFQNNEQNQNQRLQGTSITSKSGQKRDQSYDSNEELTIKERKTQAQMDNEYEIINDDISTLRRRDAIQQKNFPMSIYQDVIKIGQIQQKTKLQKILQQINIQEDDYLWWSSKHQIKVKIPKQLYKNQIQIFQNKNQKEESKQQQPQSLIDHPDQKVLLTKDKLYIFYIQTKQEAYDQFDIKNSEIQFGQLNKERLAKLGQDDDIEIKDVQQYDLMDFEFIQRLKQPKKSFILQVYNKESNVNDEMPHILFECSKDDQFFVLTHLIERQLPLKWQKFFEEALKIQEPDLYQFHCFLVKKNQFGMLQPRFFVLSQLFIYNCKCQFNKKGQIEYGELKWQIPIKALRKVTIKETLKNLEMKLEIDAEVQKQVLKDFKEKLVYKKERDVEFSTKRKTTARDFLWHMKRIHHWWNCKGKDNQNPPLQIDIIQAK